MQSHSIISDFLSHGYTIIHLYFSFFEFCRNIQFVKKESKSWVHLWHFEPHDQCFSYLTRIVKFVTNLLKAMCKSPYEHSRCIIFCKVILFTA